MQVFKLFQHHKTNELKKVIKFTIIQHLFVLFYILQQRQGKLKYNILCFEMSLSHLTENKTLIKKIPQF